MTNIAGYAQSFKLQGASIPRQSTGKVVRKRNRQPRSCRPCRSRRLKCDRSHPCSTCFERGEGSICSYAGDAAGTFEPGLQYENGRRSPKAGLQDRLNRLESLISQMLRNPIDSAATQISLLGSDPIGSRQDSNVADRGEYRERNDVGKSQWSAILDQIGELKTAGNPRYETASSVGDGNNERAYDDAVVGALRPVSLDSVLQKYLPSRLNVDRLLSRYFNATYVVLPIVHSTQFRRQCEVFWSNPADADPIWVATLFAVLCISAEINLVEGSESDSTVKDNFLAASGQCLVFGGYTSPNLQVIQALLLYTQCKYQESRDPPRASLLLLSMIVRLAFQLGLHREPDSSFSAFEGEMRRRSWIICRHFDLIVSYQLGLPSNIPHDWHDTKIPQNLSDDDFDQESIELPPSRPEAEITRVMYFVVKTRLMTVFAQIYHQALSLHGIKPQDIPALEAENQKQYDLIPPSLRIRPMSQSFTSSHHAILGRLNCELIYQRSICILHRRGMMKGDDISRNLCLQAAMAILTHLVDIYKEFSPTGQLRGATWMISSTTINDFLLATVILCLSLLTAGKSHHHGLSTFDFEEWTKPLSLLKEAHAICVSEQLKSKSAARVANAAASVLSRMSIQTTIDLDRDTSTASPPMGFRGSSSQMPSQVPTPVLLPIAANGSSDQASSKDVLDWDFNINTVLDGPEGFDWTAVDQYMNLIDNSQ